MKQEILISLIYESNFFADGKLQQPNKENQRIRDFILEKARTGESDSIEFSNIHKILPEIIKEDLIHGTLQNYLYKDSKNFLRQKHEMRITLRKYMSIGLKTAIRFYESAKAFYKKLFVSYDTNEDGYIDYDEFKELINKIDPEKPRWKIVAIFEETAGLQGKGNILTENLKINFDQFLQWALSHSLMDNLIDREVATKKDSTMEIEELKKSLKDNDEVILSISQ